MGDIQGLLETVQDLNIDQNTSFMKSITQGQFSLRDLYQLFEKIMAMGPLSKVMGMFPGMPQEFLSNVSDEQGSQKFKTFMCIMDSMTKAELDSDAKLFYNQTGRVYRVAKGSGAPVRYVEELLAQHRMVIYLFNLN